MKKLPDMLMMETAATMNLKTNKRKYNYYDYI